MNTARKPQGQITRGKTAPNRLRQTDIFLAVAYPHLLRHAPGLHIDLGYGAYPITTLETLQRLRRFNPTWRVVGVEIDPQRVADARPYQQPGLEFRHGGFNLPLQPGETVSIVRAFNVLRQYAESEVAAALELINDRLTDGGLLIEGTCDPPGRLLTFNLFQKQAGALARAAFVLAPRLSALGPDFQPRELQSVLPKNFIHHAQPAGLIDQFFHLWHKAWQAARRIETHPRRIFVAAARRLADNYGYLIDRRLGLLNRGFLSLSANWPLPAA
jgi:hypothetical protein